MADSRNVIGKFSDEVEQTATEVAKDVKDSVGQIIEQGFQSATGIQPTPQQIQQKQQEEQKQLLETRRKIAFYDQTDQAQKMVRQQNKQKEVQRLQEEQQRKQEKKMEKIQEQQTAKKPGAGTPEEILRSQVERKVGKGLGG